MRRLAWKQSRVWLAGGSQGRVQCRGQWPSRHQGELARYWASHCPAATAGGITNPMALRSRRRLCHNTSTPAVLTFLLCRHGPDQHVSTCNLVTTATGWDAPYNQAAAAAAARAAAAYAAAEQAGMLVEGHYDLSGAGYAYYGPGTVSNWQHH